MKKRKMIAVGLAVVMMAGSLGTTVVLAESPSQILAAKVTLKQAKEIAMKDAQAGTVTSVDFDTKKTGLGYYDVTIVDGQVEKEYRVDAASGKIIGSKTDMPDWDDDDDDDRDFRVTKPKYSMEDAESVFLAKYKNARIYDEELDWENGKAVYKLTALVGNKRVKMVIDADSRAILLER